MITIKNDKAFPVKVQYKVTGKFYNAGNAEANASSVSPFDEEIVAPGASFSFDGVIVATRDMTGAAQLGGTPEDFVPADVADKADGTVVEQNPHSTNPDPRA